MAQAAQSWYQASKWVDADERRGGHAGQIEVRQAENTVLYSTSAGQAMLRQDKKRMTPSSALLPCFWGVFTKIDVQKTVGTLILTSLLEDLGPKRMTPGAHPRSTKSWPRPRMAKVPSLSTTPLCEAGPSDRVVFLLHGVVCFFSPGL